MERWQAGAPLHAMDFTERAEILVIEGTLSSVFGPTATGVWLRLPKGLSFIAICADGSLSFWKGAGGESQPRTSVLTYSTRTAPFHDEGQYRARTADLARSTRSAETARIASLQAR